MTKQEKFLWIVQTSLLVEVNRLTAEDVRATIDASDYSLTGNWETITEAIRASELIPDELSVEDAATDYCSFMFSYQKRSKGEATREAARCPGWFARSR